MLKTRRFGYDGKGQATLRKGDDPAAAWRAVGGQPSIVEAFVAFEREISVVAARGHDGRIECFDVTENEHRDHILKVSRVPADVPAPVAAEALRDRRAHRRGLRLCRRARGGNVRGPDGAGHAVLVNEIAPRVHNSGHWTHRRHARCRNSSSISAPWCGWPLAVPLRHGRAEMINLIGDEIAEYRQWLEMPGACVHLYGKQAIARGRKMGHVTRVFQRS